MKRKTISVIGSPLSSYFEIYVTETGALQRQYRPTSKFEDKKLQEITVNQCRKSRMKKN